MTSREQPTVLAVVALLALAVVCATVLVGLGKLDGDVYGAVVLGNVIGGGIGFVAGVKGVQQGSQATTSPPPTG